MHGAIILDKPEGISSHSAVQKARRLLAERRIGHLGTLDPFATGVLVLLVGNATRLARFYRDRDKTYDGVIRFGFSTDSYDRTGAPTSPEITRQLNEQELRGHLAAFLGERLQTPPAISAKKVGGIRAYKLARQGDQPILKSAPVNIHELELTSLDGLFMGFRARVSSGTYIRSLAHELGERLGVGAHLHQLRRTAVGEFALSQAITLERMEQEIQRGAKPLIPMETLLPEFPAIILDANTTRAVAHGNSVPLDCLAPWVRLLTESGKLAAVAEREADRLYHPVVVFDQIVP